jgi:hypothetical protein
LSVAIVSGVYWLFSFLINFATPPILGSPIQIPGFLYIVAGVNLFSIFLVALALPDTKVINHYVLHFNLYASTSLQGISLEQMDKLFSRHAARTWLAARALLHFWRSYLVDRRSYSW